MTKIKDMTEGKPLGLMIRFSVPMLISNSLQLLFVLADSAIIGRILGVDAFASIGATARLHWFVFSTVLGINQGFGVLFAQRFGAKDFAGLRRAAVTAAYIAIVFGLVVGIGGVLINRQLLVIMLTPPELIDGSVTYLSWLWGGLVLVTCYNLCAMMLFSLGDSKTPLRAMIVATAVNIAFNLILIFPFGIAGVAAASLIAQTVAMAYCLLALKKTGIFAGCGIRPDKTYVKPLLCLAAPLGFRNAVIEAGGLVVQRFVNVFGTEFVAGVAAAVRMYSLLMIAGGAIEGAIATFVAQNFGAKNMARIKQGVRDGLKLALGSSVVIMLITLPLGRHILSLLIDGDAIQVNAVLDAGARHLLIMTIGLPFLYLLFLYRAALQGLGNTLIPMLSGFVELGLRIASVVLLTGFFGYWGVHLSDPLAWPFAMAMLIISYFLVYRRLTKSTV